MRYMLGNFIEKISLKSKRLKIIDLSTRHLLHLEKIPQDKRIFRALLDKKRYGAIRLTLSPPRYSMWG